MDQPRSIPPSGAPAGDSDGETDMAAGPFDRLRRIPPWPETPPPPTPRPGTAVPAVDEDNARMAWVLVGFMHSGAGAYSLWWLRDRPLLCAAVTLALAASWAWQTGRIRQVSRSRW